jgi:tetratricopeptide (TPR) repeat protein
MKSQLKPAVAAVISSCLFVGLIVGAGGCGKAPEGESSPVTVSDHIGKARVFYLQENYAKAAEMYYKALEMDPESSEVYLQLGIIYDDNLKDKTLAASYYREYLRLEPDSDMADRVRGWLEKTRAPTGPPEPASPPAGTTPLPAAVPAQGPPSPPPDARLRLTQVPLRTPPAGPAAGSYTVRGGDTLAGIARKLYGDPNAWKRIFEANRDQLESPHALKVGQVLAIPR